MLHIESIDHVVLCVADLERSIAFYVGVRWMDAAPSTPQQRNMDHLCLRIAGFDADAVRAHLERHGVPHDPAVQQNFGARGIGPSIYATDPDGNAIEIKG